MDVHARNCVLGDMDGNGKFRGNRSFITCENNIINALKAVKAKKKYLVIEAGPLANWVAQTASGYLTQVFISDPRENALIYKSSQKYDKVDTKKLCRLLRLNEFKEVYRPESDQRAVFKAAVQHYLDLRDQLTALKNKIKAYQVEIDNLFDQISLFRQAIENYKNLVYGEQRKFEEGESSLFLVNSRENKLIEAEVKLVELLGKYEKAQAGLIMALGGIEELSWIEQNYNTL